MPELTLAATPHGNRGHRWAEPRLPTAHQRDRLFFQYHNSNLSPLSQDYPQWWNGNNNTKSIWDYQNNAATLGGGSPPFRQDFGLNKFGQVEIDNNSFQIWAISGAAAPEGELFLLSYLSEAIWEDRSIVAEGRNTVTISPDMKLEFSSHFQQISDRSIQPVYLVEPSGFHNFVGTWTTSSMAVATD